jgi:hypothetical protein
LSLKCDILVSKFAFKFNVLCRYNMIARHRKTHLFDIDIPGQITFKESDTLAPGDELTVVGLYTLNSVYPELKSAWWLLNP